MVGYISAGRPLETPKAKDIIVVVQRQAAENIGSRPHSPTSSNFSDLDVWEQVAVSFDTDTESVQEADVLARRWGLASASADDGSCLWSVALPDGRCWRTTGGVAVEGEAE